jgi:hypothetical protein
MDTTHLYGGILNLSDRSFADGRQSEKALWAQYVD